MKILGIDLTYTVNYWMKLLGLKKPKETPPPAKAPVKKQIVIPPIPDASDPHFVTFNPSEIMSDKEFRNSDSMNEKDIQDFLVKKGGIILPNMSVDGHLASYWLNKHCKDQGLNPMVILSHLQKEMGAITRTKPYKKQHSYDYIMGVGAFDGKWSEKWKGVNKQFEGGVATNVKWFDRGEKNNTYPMAHKVGDSPELIINNSATYSLYRYTPWVGDKDRKIKTPKGYHTYDAPFGCFLFWKVYRGFFKR